MATGAEIKRWLGFTSGEGCLVASGKASRRAWTESSGGGGVEGRVGENAGTERRGVNLALYCPCLWEKAALGLEWRGLEVMTDTTL